MIRGLVHDRRGVSVVEFAICLPFLCTLYVGSYQITDAVSAYRKVGLATRSIADLTSQFTSVSDTDLDDILNSSQQVLTPYALNKSHLSITQVKVIRSDGNSGSCSGVGGAKCVAIVDWSRGMNTPALGTGTVVALNSSLLVSGSYMLVGTISYDYVPVIATSMIGPITMKDQIVMSARSSPSVIYRGS